MIYRIWTYVRHFLTAWNTTGEAIHSPYLFYLVRFLMREENSFYCFEEIEQRREALLTDTRELQVVDYGSAGSPEGKKVIRKVCEIAKTHLENPKIGQLLFRLIANMSHDEGRPLEVLELGTSLGVTTAYLASANSKNRVMTFEGSKAVANVAWEQWKALRLENIECVEGRIEDTLYKHAREKLDVAYVDANHTYEATMQYVDFLLPRMREKGIIVIDDIYYSKEMECAWKALKADKRVTTTMDLWHCGILFVDPHYLKRHYRIRI